MSYLRILFLVSRVIEALGGLIGGASNLRAAISDVHSTAARVARATPSSGVRQRAHRREVWAARELHASTHCALAALHDVAPQLSCEWRGRLKLQMRQPQRECGGGAGALLLHDSLIDQITQLFVFAFNLFWSFTYSYIFTKNNMYVLMSTWVQ